MIGRALLAVPLLGRLLRALAGAPRPVADPDETNRVAAAVDHLEHTAERRLGYRREWPLERSAAAIRDVLHDEARRIGEGA